MRLPVLKALADPSSRKSLRWRLSDTDKKQKLLQVSATVCMMLLLCSRRACCVIEEEIYCCVCIASSMCMCGYDLVVVNVLVFRTAKHIPCPPNLMSHCLHSLLPHLSLPYRLRPRPLTLGNPSFHSSPGRTLRDHLQKNSLVSVGCFQLVRTYAGVTVKDTISCACVFYVTDAWHSAHELQGLVVRSAKAKSAGQMPNHLQVPKVFPSTVS